uniref:Uncharacterized protein n=1 Tax=Xiphophorus couchianus TaxID=32473 RepID=A0A3B5LD46_9TELE
MKFRKHWQLFCPLRGCLSNTRKCLAVNIQTQMLCEQNHKQEEILASHRRSWTLPDVCLPVLQGVPQLALCLSEEHEQHMKSATVWSLDQIGHHTTEHAKVVATANLLPKLLALYMDASSSEDLQAKSKKALKNILQKCTLVSALEPLLYDAPSNILKHVVCQFSKVLPHDSKARRLFVTSGGLKKIQEIDAEPGSALQEYINAINSCFPEEIVRCSSDNSTTIMPIWFKL